MFTQKVLNAYKEAFTSKIKKNTLTFEDIKIYEHLCTKIKKKQMVSTDKSTLTSAKQFRLTDITFVPLLFIYGKLF